MPYPQDHDELSDRIHEVNLDVGVLKKDNEIQTKLMEKFDKQLDVLTELAQAMNRAVSVHTEKWTGQEKINSFLKEAIDKNRAEGKESALQMELRIEEKQAAVLAKLEAVHQSVSNMMIANKTTSDSEDKKKIDVIGWLIENWKFVAFIFTFFAGIASNKWGLFNNLFGGAG